MVKDTVSNSLWPHELYSLWNSSGQNTGEGSLSLLQVIFPIQGLNPSLPHCRWILYHLSHKGSFPKLKMVLRSIIQSLETNTAVVFLEELSSLYQLLGRYLSNTKVWITILQFISDLSKNAVTMYNSGLVHLATQ